MYASGSIFSIHFPRPSCHPPPSCLNMHYHMHPCLHASMCPRLIGSHQLATSALLPCSSFSMDGCMNGPMVGSVGRMHGMSMPPVRACFMTSYFLHIHVMYINERQDARKTTNGWRNGCVYMLHSHLCSWTHQGMNAPAAICPPTHPLFLSRYTLDSRCA